MLKKISIFVAIGALLGCVLFTWMGPTAIGWWFSPPVNIGIDCRDAIKWAMDKLIIVQMVGIGIGILSGVVLSLVFRKKPNP